MEEEIVYLSDEETIHDSVDIVNITKKLFPTKKTLEIFSNFLKEKLPTFKIHQGKSVLEKYFPQLNSELEMVGGNYLTELLNDIRGEGLVETSSNEIYQFTFTLDNLTLSLESTVITKPLSQVSESDLNFISEYITEKILICLEIAYEETIATIEGIGEKFSIFWHQPKAGILDKKDSLLPPFYLHGLIANLQFNFFKGLYTKELITLDSPEAEWIKKARQVVLREEQHRYRATLLLLGEDPQLGDFFGSLILNYDIPNPRFSPLANESWEASHAGKRTPEECRCFLTKKWDEAEWAGFLPHEHGFRQFWLVILGDGQLVVYEKVMEGYSNERQWMFRSGDLMSSGQNPHKLGSHVKFQPLFSRIRNIFYT